MKYWLIKIYNFLLENTKIRRLTLFRETIIVYCEKQTKNYK
jgi:hypothetical protein